MTTEFNRTGAERKKLVQAIAEITGKEAKYLGVPSCSYRVGDYIIEKNGTLIFPDQTEYGDATEILAQLADRGFTADLGESSTEEGGTAETESVGLTISVPFEETSVGNLTNLLESKGDLIKEALGIDDIRIEMGDTAVSFPWFPVKPEDPEAVKAYTHFIAAICNMAKTQVRISSAKKEVDNKKYAFRCFLLRLGFIGDEYKKERKILLQNLEGSSAFKGGAKHDISE